MRMKCRVQQLENGGMRITCGPIRQNACQVAGCDEDHVALCDYPAGDGRTCDQQICGAHRTRVGANIDYCPDHRDQIGINAK